MASSAAALIARARREIQHHFFAADAVRPERAVPFEAGNGFEQRQFATMRGKDIIREAGAGRYWLDVVAYDVELRRRHSIRRNALLAIIVVLLGVLALGAYKGSTVAPAATHQD